MSGGAILNVFLELSKLACFLREPNCLWFFLGVFPPQLKNAWCATRCVPTPAVGVPDRISASPASSSAEVEPA